MNSEDQKMCTNPCGRPDGGIARRSRQHGATTLIVAIVLLGILTIIVLFSTNVAFFEQRTATGENRARVGEQAAELSLNISGEWLKSRLTRLVSSATADGWLSPDTSGATTRRWASCVDAAVEIAKDYVHPCESLEGGGILGTSVTDPPYTNLFFYARGGDATGNADMRSASFASAYNVFDDPDLQGDPVLADLMDESLGTWTVEPRVQAVMCRIDTSIPGSPRCRLAPELGNNISITMVAGAQIDSELTDAIVMETWGTYGEFTPSSAVPLVASGTVKGLGNAQIVGSPNAGGFGLAASIWSPCAVEISGNETQPAGCEEPTSSGVGSVSTCHLEGFLSGAGVSPENMLLDDAEGGCANSNQCGCPGTGDRNFLSGHSGSDKLERFDILDRDGNQGSPDITFFPGSGLDDPADPSDDNLFEWIFGLDYVSKSAGGDLENDGNGATSTDCGEDADEDCAVWALENELGAQLVTCAQLGALGANAFGLYYVTDGVCGLPSQLGTPDAPVVVVVDNEAQIGANTLIYGMLFVRHPTSDATITGNGNAQVFGSVVVEGDADLSGGVDLIYVDWAARSGNPENPPPARNFGRVSGSWLDAARGL